MDINIARVVSDDVGSDYFLSTDTFHSLAVNRALWGGANKISLGKMFEIALLCTCDH